MDRTEAFFSHEALISEKTKIWKISNIFTVVYISLHIIHVNGIHKEISGFASINTR